MDNTILNGQLEIDHERGVIYFHVLHPDDAMKIGNITPLRICSLPKPIPSLQDFQLDITHMHGASWKAVNGKDYTKTDNVHKDSGEVVI